MILPVDIEQVFFDTLNGYKTILEFEQWVYSEEQLEGILGSDHYLDLISYNYKADGAKYGLFNLIEKYIDKGEFEKRRIRSLLVKALDKDDKLPEILMVFYDCYCKGYDFLDNLALGYGLRIEVPEITNYEETWYDLNDTQKNTLLASFYPDLDTEIKKVISWIDSGKIILTGTRDSTNCFEYIDNRTEFERQSTVYKTALIDRGRLKKWWKFWWFLCL